MYVRKGWLLASIQNQTQALKQGDHSNWIIWQTLRMNVENDVQTKGATYQSARPTVAKARKD